MEKEWGELGEKEEKILLVREEERLLMNLSFLCIECFMVPGSHFVAHQTFICGAPGPCATQTGTFCGTLGPCAKK